MRPSFALTSRPLDTEGAVLPQEGSRECRALDAPAALRAKVESTQASHHGHAANTRHSPRNGFTAYSALSRVTGLSCHPRRRKLLLANLTPASGRQDHTASPSARNVIRLLTCRVHSIPSRVRDDREPPLQRDGTARDKQVIWVKWKQEYFCKRGWTPICCVARRASSGESGMVLRADHHAYRTTPLPA
jgi:hypothetical protein